MATQYSQCPERTTNQYRMCEGNLSINAKGTMTYNTNGAKHMTSNSQRQKEIPVAKARKRSSIHDPSEKPNQT